MRAIFLMVPFTVTAMLVASLPASAAPVAVPQPGPGITAAVEPVAQRRIVKKRVVVKPGKRAYATGPRYVRGYRGWSKRPHYGKIFAGVALGTIIGAAIANAAPPPPSPDLCWYWSNRARTEGYWDYCR